jgi:mutator protein MutT
MGVRAREVTDKWWPTPDGVIPVYAAVIEREGCWLLGQRPLVKRHGGLWEFPGGKLEPGESLADAATRELAEELGVEVDRIGDVLFARCDEASHFEIIFVATSIIGEPRALEHAQLAWVAWADAPNLALAPSDAAFVRRGGP